MNLFSNLKQPGSVMNQFMLNQNKNNTQFILTYSKQSTVINQYCCRILYSKLHSDILIFNTANSNQLITSNIFRNCLFARQKIQIQ
ncbi:hypothetical protein TTHERM_002653475, partial (macronuclear) [Tetrahymena thermophila SB210]